MWPKELLSTTHSFPISTMSKKGEEGHRGLNLYQTPVNYFQQSAMNAAEESVECLPTGNLQNNHIANSQPISKELKLKAQSLGQSTSQKHETSMTARKNGSLLDYVGMGKVEIDFYQLVFDRDVFRFPKCQDRSFLSKRQIIESKMKNREHGHNSHLPATLLIRKEESEDLVRAFSRCKSPFLKGQKPAFPAEVAQKARFRFHRFATVWKKAYYDQLGIDFEAS
jgi:hypothetical protein